MPLNHCCDVASRKVTGRPGSCRREEAAATYRKLKVLLKVGNVVVDGILPRPHHHQARLLQDLAGRHVEVDNVCVRLRGVASPAVCLSLCRKVLGLLSFSVSLFLCVGVAECYSANECQAAKLSLINTVLSRVNSSQSEREVGQRDEIGKRRRSEDSRPSSCDAETALMRPASPRRRRRRRRLSLLYPNTNGAKAGLALPPSPRPR